MSNKKEKRKTINSFGVSEDELKNSIIQYETLPPEKKENIKEVGGVILEDIIHKIKNVVSEINDERLKKANISSLGTTLKSLVQAYHFLELHFSLDNPNEFKFDEDENVLEKVSEITFRTKKKWEKGK